MDEEGRRLIEEFDKTLIQPLLIFVQKNIREPCLNRSVSAVGVGLNSYINNCGWFLTKFLDVVRRTLNKYGYPPDKQQKAIDTGLKQAELLADYFVKG